MNDNGIQEAVCEVIRVALGPDLQVDRDFRREEQPAWDSLKHIEIILALEDRFNIQFSEADMQQMQSVANIARRIMELI